jgi:hypothetical protein
MQAHKASRNILFQSGKSGPRLIPMNVSYRYHRILEVWSRNVRCKSPNLAPPAPISMVPCCTEFGVLEPCLMHFSPKIGTLGSSFAQLWLWLVRVCPEEATNTSWCILETTVLTMAAIVPKFNRNCSKTFWLWVNRGVNHEHNIAGQIKYALQTRILMWSSCSTIWEALQNPGWTLSLSTMWYYMQILLN